MSGALTDPGAFALAVPLTLARMEGVPAEWAWPGLVVMPGGEPPAA